MTYFDHIKQALLQTINELTIENIEEKERFIQELCQALVLISSLEKKIPYNETAVQSMVEKEVTGERLIRRLRGGWLEKAQVYVPEKVIRKNQWETGDWIDVKKEDEQHYQFQLVKKEPLEDNREEYPFCIVEKSDIGELSITIKDETLEIPVTIILSKTDIQRFHLKEGDVIDYASPKNELLKGVVIWKHSVPKQTIEKEKTLPLHIEKKKKDIEGKKEQIPSIFDGKQILMVGGDHQKLQKKNREAVEKRKGIFLYLTGDESEKRIRATVRKADMIVVYTQSVGHQGMYTVKEFSKRYEIPTSYTKTIGVHSFIERCRYLLKKSNYN